MPTVRRARASQAELAAALGVTPAAICQNPGIAKNPDGSIDAEATLSLNQVRERTERAQLDKEIAIAAKHELDLAERRGTVVAAEKVAAEWSSVAQMVRDGVLAIPDRISPRLVGKTSVREIRELLMVELRKALQGLSEQVETAA